MLTTRDKTDTNKARIYYPNGLVRHYNSNQMAYAIWLSARKGIRIAFRGSGDTTPVRSHDYVDRF